jgi:diguanylate cyclase (GGDEF)-like protein
MNDIPRLLHHVSRHSPWINDAADRLEQRVPPRPLELDGALAELSDAHQKLKDFSRIDGLTGIKNRAYFNEKIGIEWPRAMREQHTLALLMIDIDHFKRINDSYGHPTGDICLQEVARALAAQLSRASDDVFRFGGEEFIAMLPNTDLAGAMHVAGLMREAVEGLDIFPGGASIPVTVSIGLACMVPVAGYSAEALLADADKALYRAKHDGRNRICSGAPLAAAAALL